MSRVVHFEIHAADMEKSAEFYEKTFGWEFNRYDEKYWLITTGSEGDAGINGGMMKRGEGHPLTININAENIDEAVAAVESNGGEIVVPKFALPNVGWAAYFKDPDEVLAGIWQDDTEAR